MADENGRGALATALRKLEAHYRGLVPGALPDKIARWIETYGAHRVLALADRILEADARGRPVRNVAGWMEVSLRNEAAVVAATRCRGCVDGFLEAEKRCCPCESGERRRRNLIASAKREFTLAVEKARTFEEIERAKTWLGKKYENVLKGIPRKPWDPE